MGRASAMRSKENLAVKLSPREKHSQSSFQILDDVSNRYYREIVPISVQDSKTDLKKSDSILRQHRDIVVQTSLGEDTPTSSDRGTCEMACQTRESLFQPIVRQKSITSSSPNQSVAAIRFSTFGYDVPPPPPPLSSKHTLTRQSTNKSRATPTTIELEDLGTTEFPQRQPPHPPEVCHHHHQHQQHLQQQQQQQQRQQQQHQEQHQHQVQQQQQHHHQPHQHHHTTTTGKGKQQQKADESKVFIDIRNSAPDVIIMTSH